MRFAAASQLVADRTVACAGLAAGEGPDVMHIPAVPRDLARRLLVGHVDGREMEAVLDGIRNGTLNALDTMSRSLLATGNPADAAGSLHVLITQMMLIGILVGSGGARNGDGASQRPSSDFDGATE